MNQQHRSSQPRAFLSVSVFAFVLFSISACSVAEKRIAEEPHNSSSRRSRAKSEIRSEIRAELRAAHLSTIKKTDNAGSSVAPTVAPVSGGTARTLTNGPTNTLAKQLPAKPAPASKITKTAKTTNASVGLTPSRLLNSEIRDKSGSPSTAKQSTDTKPTEPGKGLTETSHQVPQLKKLGTLEKSTVQLSSPGDTPIIFDIPVTYNSRVSQWIQFFQTRGRRSFRIWLERSARFLPLLQYELTEAGLPQDLVYVAMIESGFSSHAHSHAGAMGMWQFIAPTGQRYGLKIDWWIDERRDFHKATRAAIRYMSDLYKQFNSWYLVAASYNMGENGVRRLIKKHGTNNFWELADRGALPNETTDYVPKIIAAILISKAPGLYGFRDLNYEMPLSFEYTTVPGGTDLINLASYLGVSEKYLQDLNPELLKGFVPRDVASHKIRVPKGAMMTVSQYIRLQSQTATN